MLKNIATNIVTGFLGAGKSTAILNLLQHKPEQESWAILVNEFGEVGIDGSILGGAPDAGVHIREIPGGCMCCAAGLPMQIAMNMLLARAKPQRLIIEPTGLGHPIEVMSVLAADHYQELLDLRATLTLVDARKISDARYTRHETFNQQLEVADVIVASKQDLYGPQDFSQLEIYLQQQGLLADRTLVKAAEGEFSQSWLQGKAEAWLGKVKPAELTQPSAETTTEPTLVFPAEGYIRRNNQGEGYQSFGWIFESNFTFQQNDMVELVTKLAVDRFKAVLRSDAGAFALNYAGDALKVSPLEHAADSRIEVITAAPFDDARFENQLLDIATR